MQHLSEKLLVICDDDLLNDIIYNILSKFDTFQIEIKSVNDFIDNHSAIDNTAIFIVDERREISKLLKINALIKQNSPQSFLIVLTDYIERDFDSEFTKSGADFVMPINNIHSELPQICSSK